jgi:hypothetical protein
MPAINPNNYNIDFFQSYAFGDITDNSYLSYLFQQNLPDIVPELINGPAGNFQSQYDEKGLEKNINYSQITNPGTIDEWLQGGNFSVNLLDTAYQNPSQNIGNNQYGPSSLEAFNYENPDLIVEDTGYVGYQTSVGGGIVNNILTEGLDAVGLGGLNSFLIDFDSPLNDIAKERRIEEAKNRIKDGIIENTVGRINLDPLNLLSGGGIFEPSYKITKPTGGLLGNAINLTSDIAGVDGLKNLIGGDLPDGAFDWDSPITDPFSPSTIDITKTLLKRTGKGTRNLLYDAISQNRFGPRIEGQNDSLKKPLKAEDSNQPSQKTGYLAFGNRKEFNKQEKKEQRNRKGSARQQTSNLASTDQVLDETTVNAKGKGRRNRNDIPIAPTEAENPSLYLNVNEKFKFQGFEFTDFGIETDFTYEGLLASWNRGHNSNWLEQKSFLAPLRTLGPERLPGEEGKNDGAEPGPQVFKGGLYWQDGVANDVLPKRGLLNYTQQLINKSTNVSGTAARFIGLPNSDQNYELQGAGNDRKHTLMSQGNLVKSTKKNQDGVEPYCRSWSVRNAYNKYSDLIRYSELWREVQPGTTGKAGAGGPNRPLGSFSTLRSPGIPKIAWERDDFIESKIKVLKQIQPDPKNIIPYMFSIENLAWKDSPHYSKLPNCEKGPHGGRIMWFPPYNINFTDNTSVNWDTTNFIGRAEPIYTYNNTERTGTLSFSIVVDHPSILNKLKEGAFTTTTINEDGDEVVIDSSENLETFFAGCNNDEIKQIVREAFKEIVVEEEEIEEAEEIERVDIEIEQPPEQPDYLSYHFKNATKKYTEQLGYCVGKVNNIACKGDRDKYYDGFTKSACPEGTKYEKDINGIGRCFDFYWEIEEKNRVDNPHLYKGASSRNGKNTECSEPSDSIVSENYSITELIPVPSTDDILPCIGKGGGPGSTGFKAYGPKNGKWSRKVTDANGRTTSKGFPDSNYCCELVNNGVTGATISGIDYKIEEVGLPYVRPGFNQRFWGTGNYPAIFNTGIGNQSGRGPKLEIVGLENYEYKFEVIGSIPSNTGGVGTGISQLIEFLTSTSLGKMYTINLTGQASKAGPNTYNEDLSKDRTQAVYKWMKQQMENCEQLNGIPKLQVGTEETDIELFSETDDITTSCGRWNLQFIGSEGAQAVNTPGVNAFAGASSQYVLTPGEYHPGDYQNITQAEFRRVDIVLKPNLQCVQQYYDEYNEQKNNEINNINEEAKQEVARKRAAEKARAEAERQKALDLAKDFINECDYFLKIQEEDSFLYDNIKDKLKNFHPAFHSITPEGFNTRITFLQQCGRQGPSMIDPGQPQNTAFGRPPVCILRLGDFYFTKIIIDSINFTFDPLQWDLNPEGIGVQPMLVNVDLNFKFIGGSTLQGPLTQLQNAVSYNFFANTALYMPLEKILEKRKKFSLTGVGLDQIDGVVGVESEEVTEDTGFVYGPWASPQGEAIAGYEKENNFQEEPNADSIDLEETVQSDYEEPTVKSSGSGCINETLLSNPEKLFILNSDSTPNTGFGAVTFAEVRENPDNYDCYYCNDPIPSLLYDTYTWVPIIQKVSDINQSENETEVRGGNEYVLESFTTPNENGEIIFEPLEFFNQQPVDNPGVPLANDTDEGSVYFSENITAPNTLVQLSVLPISIFITRKDAFETVYKQDPSCTTGCVYLNKEGYHFTNVKVLESRMLNGLPYNPEGSLNYQNLSNSEAEINIFRIILNGMVYGDTLEDRFGSDWVQKTNEEFDSDPNKELPYSVIAEVTATPINEEGEVDDNKIQLSCKTLTKGVIKKAGWEKLKNTFTNNWGS